MAWFVNVANHAVGCVNKHTLSKPGWKPNTNALAACLEGLKVQRDVELSEELFKLVMENYHFEPVIYDRLKTCIEYRNL
jgi:hypothetical protein